MSQPAGATPLLSKIARVGVARLGVRLALAVVVAGVAGCGVTDHAATSSVSASGQSPYAEPLTQPWPIAAVARTHDPRVIAVSITGVPTAPAGELCHADVAYDVAEAPLSIGVAVTVTSRLASPFTGCAMAGRQLLVRLTHPVGRRDVFAADRVTSQGGRFIAVGDRYVECRPPSCDPEFVPEVPDCTHLREAIAGTDVPAHFGMAGPCRMPYAAIVVDIGAGACPVTGEANPCAGKRLTRQFWWSDGTRWRLVYQGEHATCADAHHALARFPVAMCADAQWIRATQR